MKTVKQGIRKKDAMALVTGRPVYTDDLAPKNCLIVKLLGSPHAHARISEIDAAEARGQEGVACVLTYKDVPQVRFTTAGQTYPEPSPYDRLILDAHLRFMGDAVAIVAGVDEKTVERALKLIRVKYEVLEPVLDFRTAKDNPVLVHPEDDFLTLKDVGADRQRNLCSAGGFAIGNFAGEYEECAVKVEQTYHTKANQQAHMETFRTYTELDAYGRLNVVSSTQIPFHVRRILANALQMEKSRIRVIKPRIGGGFGAKQSVVSELYPAIVTVKTGKPAKIVFSRQETFVWGTPRHEMEIKVKLGADRDGRIKAISMYALSNAGAYGAHGPTTVDLTGRKPMAIYNRAGAYHFQYDVVYTNTPGGGAYRSYGAVQGLFALESAVNELAKKIGMDPTALREINIVREGQTMPADYNEKATSCALDRCLARVKEMIGWERKYPFVRIGEQKVRSVGIALAVQGSGIPNVDVGTVEIRLSDGGFYTLLTGSADMGTGADTVLAQIAAERLKCRVEDIAVHGVDTDQSPYDSGSYASKTTYVTGMAVVKTCDALIGKIRAEGARHLGCAPEETDFDGRAVSGKTGEKESKRISLSELANKSMDGPGLALSASVSHSSPASPPPYMAGAVEIELDLETGKIDLIDFAAAIDCGTPINPNLARVQAEGGIVQGIGMALYEDVLYDAKGRLLSDSFLQYKIPTRLDIGKIRVEFVETYEPSGPFGAKSVGEIAINTPPAAIAHAVYNAAKVNIRTLPITSEKIILGMESPGQPV